MIELRPIGTGVTVQQTAIVTTRPPDRKRTLSIVSALAVVGLVAFGLAKVFGGDSADEATSPTSTVPATTTIPVATTAPASTVAPATTAPPSTTAYIPATTTTIPYVNQRRGVVLDDAQSGRSMYFVNGADLYRVELGTGRVTSRRPGSNGNGIGLYGVIGGRVLISGVNGQSVGSLAGDLSGEVTNIDLGAFSLSGPSWTAADGFWVLRYSNAPGVPTVVRRVSLAGKVLAELTLPADVYPVGFLGDRAVIAQYGRIWTIGADGLAMPYATGSVILAQGGVVLWVSCDDTLRCTFHLGNATTADTGRTSLETSYLAAWPNGSEGGMQSTALAPDAATVIGMVLTNGPGDGRQKIVDLATGSTLDLSGQGYSALGWTPNGDWVIEPTLSGEFVATNVRTGRRVSIAYPAALATRNSVNSLVVG